MDGMFQQFFHQGGGFHFKFGGGGGHDDAVEKHRINFKYEKYLIRKIGLAN